MKERMKPKVSIVVPIYNVEQFLDRTMQSLIAQTLKNIEIIMVDDESPDNCPAICDQYAQQYPNIKVVHKKNAVLEWLVIVALMVQLVSILHFVIVMTM